MNYTALCLATALFFTGSNCGKPKQKKRYTKAKPQAAKAQAAKSMKKTCFECSQELSHIVFLQHKMRVNKALRAALPDGAEKLGVADISWIRQEYKRMDLPLCASKYKLRRVLQGQNS